MSERPRDASATAHEVHGARRVGVCRATPGALPAVVWRRGGSTDAGRRIRRLATTRSRDVLHRTDGRLSYAAVRNGGCARDVPGACVGAWRLSVVSVPL